LGRRFHEQRIQLRRVRQADTATVESVRRTARIERDAGQLAWRTRVFQSEGACPVRAVAASTIFCNASMSSSARNCASLRSASCRSQSTSVVSRIVSHIMRDDVRSPPLARVVAAIDCSHHGAPSTLAAFSNQWDAVR